MNIETTFPDYNIEVKEDTGHDIFKLTTNVRVKLKKKWYNIKCSRSYKMDDSYSIKQREDALMVLIKRFIKDCYNVKYLTNYVLKESLSFNQLSEKDRLTLISVHEMGMTIKLMK